MIFAPTEEKNLRLFQFIYLFLLVFTYLGITIRFIPIYKDLPYLALDALRPLFGAQPPPFALWLVSFVGFTAAAAAAALGWRPKLMLAIAMPMFFIYIGALMGFDGHLYTIDRAPRVNNFVLPVLALLLATPGSILQMPLRALLEPGSRRSRFQTLGLLKITLALFYFANGYAKLKHGASWLDGSTLQSLLLDSWVRNESPVAYALAQHAWLCQILGALVLGFELFAPVLLFLPHGELVFVAFGLSFHLGVALFLQINFFYFPFIGLYLAFFRAAWLTSAPSGTSAHSRSG